MANQSLKATAMHKLTCKKCVINHFVHVKIWFSGLLLHVLSPYKNKMDLKDGISEKKIIRLKCLVLYFSRSLWM